MLFLCWARCSTTSKMRNELPNYTTKIPSVSKRRFPVIHSCQDALVDVDDRKKTWRYILLSAILMNLIHLWRHFNRNLIIGAIVYILKLGRCYLAETTATKKGSSTVVLDSICHWMASECRGIKYFNYGMLGMAETQPSCMAVPSKHLGLRPQCFDSNSQCPMIKTYNHAYMYMRIVP